MVLPRKILRAKSGLSPYRAHAVDHFIAAAMLTANWFNSSRLYFGRSGSTEERTESPRNRGTRWKWT